jgi:pilus assembly protein CpaE
VEGFDAAEWHEELLGQHGSGLGVLSMAHTAVEAVTLTPHIVEVVLTSLQKAFPVVLVDTTSVYADVNLAAIGKSTRLLLISHYELTGLRAMMECVTALEDPDHPLETRAAFILNNTRARPAIRAQEFEARVRLTVESQLPYGDDLPSVAARDGTPVVEMKAQSSLARELAQLAGRLVTVPAAPAQLR